MSENPKCPYCGGEMKFSYGYDSHMNGHYLYRCDNCNALAPEANSPEEAYDAAMKRDRAKGKWITVSESAWDGGEYKCFACGWECCDDEFGDDPTEDYRFCPNCGANMGKEVNDEREKSFDER